MILKSFPVQSRVMIVGALPRPFRSSGVPFRVGLRVGGSVTRVDTLTVRFLPINTPNEVMSRAAHKTQRGIEPLFAFFKFLERLLRSRTYQYWYYCHCKWFGEDRQRRLERCIMCPVNKGGSCRFGGKMKNRGPAYVLGPPQ